MKSNKKYKRLKHNKKLAGFIDIHKSLYDFNSVDEALNYIFKNQRNAKIIKSSMEENVPGILYTINNNDEYKDFRTENTKVKAYIKGRILGSRDIAHKRHKYPDIATLITNEFKTESYIAREKRYAMNLTKLFSHREKGDFVVSYKDKKGKTKTRHTKSRYQFNKEREFLKERFGSYDLSDTKIVYYDKLPSDMDLSPNSKDRGYVAKDENGNFIIFELVDEKVSDTEYKLNIVIRYRNSDGKWATL